MLGCAAPSFDRLRMHRFSQLLPASAQRLKKHYPLELLVAAADLGFCESLEAIQAEVLHVVAGHGAAVYDRLAQVVVVQLAGAGDVAHESASEAVARACGVGDFLKGI